MVKRNSYLYHLSDLLPLKHVFRGSENSWFLYVNVSLPIRREKKRKKRRRKAKRLPEFSHERLEKEFIVPKERIYEQDLHLSKVSDSNVTVKSPCESLSGIVSVSGIINRYFTNSFDIDHIESTANSEVTPKIGLADVENNNVSTRSSKKNTLVKTQPRLLPSCLQDSSNSALMNKYERSEVGRRLVVASKNLESSQRSTSLKVKKLWDRDAVSIIRDLVFELDDNE